MSSYLQVKTIAFNPVTTTNLVKTLTRIALHESQRGVRRFRSDIYIY